MASPFTKQERQIAKQLGVTPAGLMVLMRQAAGKIVSGGTAGNPLRKLGYLEDVRQRRLDGGTYPGSRITDAGRALVAEARRMGW